MLGSFLTMSHFYARVCHAGGWGQSIVSPGLSR